MISVVVLMGEDRIQAAVTYGPRKVKLECVRLPDLGVEDVSIRVKAVGICGTDLKIFEGTKRVRLPLIQGHEFSGYIVEARTSRDLKKGDRVTCDVDIPCGGCLYCKQGKYNLCEHIDKIGITRNGAFAEYIVVPARNVFKIPDSLSDREAALVDTLGCALHAIRRAKINSSDTIAIIGAGASGLLMLQLAKLLYASKVIVIERILERLEVAKELGADHVISARCNGNPVNQALEMTSGDGVDVVLEAAGTFSAVDTALRIVKKGGTMIFYGSLTEEIYVQTVTPLLSKIMKAELNIFGSKSNPSSSKDALDLVTDGKVNVKRLITHTFPLSRIEDAFKIISERLEGVIKVVLFP